MVKPIPDRYHTITPYFTTNDANGLIEFLEKAFDGTADRHQLPDGTLIHAEVRIGTSIVMIGQARGEWTPMPGVQYVYVEDCDAVYQKALIAGGESLMEPTDMFYGDRNGAVKDPAGNHWWIATHIKDVTPEELQKHADSQGKSQ